MHPFLPRALIGHIPKKSFNTLGFNHFTIQQRNMSDIKTASRIAGIGPSIWVKAADIIAKNADGLVNLGQGLPNYHAMPEHLIPSLEATIATNVPSLHQYARSQGQMSITKALAKLYGQLLGRPLNAEKEIVVTVGACEALSSTLLGYCNPGDEVIIIEPFFSDYEGILKLTGAKPVTVQLKPPSGSSGSQNANDWTLDPKELESAFSPSTKVILLNTPNNPLGKVFSRSELEMIGSLAQKNNALILSDEVYEWLTYDDERNQFPSGDPLASHVRIATLPGMWDRTITVGSAGKAFHVTGWKCGWAIGPANLVAPTQTVHSKYLYSSPTLQQEAVARSLERELEIGLDSPQSYWRICIKDLQKKRDMMAAAFRDVGLTPIIPQGGYFMMVDISKLNIHNGQLTPEKLFSWFIEKKLLVIPMSSFYFGSSPEFTNTGLKYVRICFIKDDDTLSRAVNSIKGLKQFIKQ